MCVYVCVCDTVCVCYVCIIYIISSYIQFLGVLGQHSQVLQGSPRHQVRCCDLRRRQRKRKLQRSQLRKAPGSQVPWVPSVP